jgi:hypothetical protein
LKCMKSMKSRWNSTKFMKYRCSWILKCSWTKIEFMRSQWKLMNLFKSHSKQMRIANWKFSIKLEINLSMKCQLFLRLNNPSTTKMKCKIWEDRFKGWLMN